MRLLDRLIFRITGVRKTETMVKILAMFLLCLITGISCFVAIVETLVAFNIV